MYKVFVNVKPLFLTNEIAKETDFQLFLLESIDIEQLITKMFNNKITKCYLYYPDENVIFKKLTEKIPVQRAGGGLVYNKNGEVLFIFRNGKWDLPKGGKEKGEKMSYTALREVEEETGVNKLIITDKLQKSLGASGANFMHSSGKDAEQSVFHFHFHVVPRYESDLLNMHEWWRLKEQKTTIEELKELAEKIKA